MGYMHIQNLYKSQDILLFKRCYAMEKIHGTSAHVKYKRGSVCDRPYDITYFSGGFSPDVFKAQFDEAAIGEKLLAMGHEELTIYGEFYGGKIQGASETYGKSMKFVAFDILHGTEEDGSWLDVPTMTKVCQDLGIEVVDWKEVDTELTTLDAERDADSTQAIRNGMGPGKKREGVVLRPIYEFTDRRGNRLIVKHKRDDFMETKTPRPVVDPAHLKVLQDAQAIADEWVVPNRLEHVLQKIPSAGIADMRNVLNAMVEDVQREAGTEIVWSREAMAAVSKKTAEMFKKRLNDALKE